MDDAFRRVRLGRLLLWPLAALGLLGIATLLTGPRHSTTILTAGGYLLYAAFFAACISACRDRGIRWTDVIGGFPDDPAPWTRALVLAPLLLLFSASCAWLTLVLAGTAAPDWAATQLAERDGPGLLDRFGRIEKGFLAVLITFAGPFAEEFAFRGVILRKWVAKYGVRAGIFGSAALFAVLHPHMSVGAFAFGVVLAVLYLWSGSLWPPTLIHMINNGLVTIASLGADPAPSARAPADALSALRGEWLIPLTVAAVAGSAIVALTRPMFRQLRSRNDGQGAA